MQTAEHKHLSQQRVSAARGKTSGIINKNIIIIIIDTWLWLLAATLPLFM